MLMDSSQEDVKGRCQTFTHATNSTNYKTIKKYMEPDDSEFGFQRVHLSVHHRVASERPGSNPFGLTEFLVSVLHLTQTLPKRTKAKAPRRANA